MSTERISNIYRTERRKKAKADRKYIENKYGEFAYILRQDFRRTKMYANLGKITYGTCREYIVFTSPQVAAAAVTGKDDVLYKIPSALLQTKTVENLVPWLESQISIPIGAKMLEVMQ